MAEFSKYAVATAVEAWKDAGFARKGVEGDAGFSPDMDRVATLFGNGIGGLEVTGESFKTLFERGPDRLSPLAIPELIANEAAGNVAIALGAKGPSQVVVTACASSTDALGFAFARLGSLESRAPLPRRIRLSEASCLRARGATRSVATRPSGSSGTQPPPWYDNVILRNKITILCGLCAAARNGTICPQRLTRHNRNENTKKERQKWQR